ncbi:MAG: GGDEF domain-containing protein [Lysobacteraceae bacterium]
MPREVALQTRRSESRLKPDAGANWDMVLFLIDIDHFKSINDAHGHAIGDIVLRQIAERLRAVFRSSDHLVRWVVRSFCGGARSGPAASHRPGRARGDPSRSSPS